MSEPVKAALLLFSLGLLAGCAGDAGESTADTAAPTQLMLSSTPRIAFGGLDERPEYSFSVVSAGAFIGPDKFVILDSQGHELKIYSTSGEHLHTFGRQGDGPGELGRLPELLPSAEGTIRIWDGLQQRLTVFDDEGRYLSSVQPMGAGEVRFVQLAGALSDNRVIWKQPNQSRGADDPPTGEYRDTIFHVLRRADGTSDTLAWTLASEAFRGDADGQPLSTPVLFGREGFAVVGGNRLIYGVSDEPRLLSKSPDGSEGPSFRWDMGRDPISGREIDSLRMESSAPWKTRQETGGPQLVTMAGAQLRLIAAAPARETRPHFSAVQVNGAGDVLVQRATELFSSKHVWVLFGEDGTLLGRFSTPRGFRVLDFTKSEILGYTLNDLDLPTIQIRALGTG
jgi:hypothetical protein